MVIDGLVEVAKEGGKTQDKGEMPKKIQNGDDEALVSRIIIPNASSDSEDDNKSETSRKTEQAFLKSLIRHLSEVKSLPNLNTSMGLRGSCSICRITLYFIGPANGNHRGCDLNRRLLVESISKEKRRKARNASQLANNDLPLETRYLENQTKI